MNSIANQMNSTVKMTTPRTKSIAMAINSMVKPLRWYVFT